MTGRSILLDEGADWRLGPWLRSEGCDVTVIGLDHPASLDDREILAIASREDRLLITRDRGFGNLVFTEGMPHSGVILLRLRRYTLDLQQERLR
jgi:predicted nuclease of predicted toxin-antitoxin system